MSPTDLTWLPRTRGDVKVRPLRPEDLARLYDIEADSCLKRYIVGGPLTTPREEWLAQATALCSSQHTFALEHLPSGAFAGRATLGHYIPANDHGCREIQILLSWQFVLQLEKRVNAQSR